jgi:hypothetical protein
MDRLLDEIPELEHRLLLYAAGELPAESAEAVEREIAENPAAREALAEVNELLGLAQSRLAAWDAEDGVAPRASRRAADRAVRAVFDWTEAENHARLLRPARRGALAEGVVWRYARWPLSAAAILVLGLMIWTFGTEPSRTPGIANSGPRSPETAGGTPVVPVGTLTTTAFQLDQAAAMFDGPAGRWDRDGDSDLTQLELGSALSDELAALRLLYEPDWE